MLFTLFLQFLFHIRYDTGAGAFLKPMNAQEEELCLHQLKLGDRKAREKLIEHNMRLVAHIARKYTISTTTWEADDLISVGAIGLIKGIDTFDVEKKAKLSTYLARCIENEILMLLRADKKTKQEVSLQEPIGEDKEGNILAWDDVLVCDEESALDRVSQEAERKELLSAIEEELSPREKCVILRRYGLLGKKEETQRQVAKSLGISRSYVSRIEKRAMEKLHAKIEKNKR